MISKYSVKTKIDTTGLKLELENNMKLQISVPDGHWTYIAITFVASVDSRSSNYNTTAHIRQYLCWDHVSKVVQVSVSEVQSVEYQSCCIHQDKKLFHVMLQFTSVLRFRIPVFAFPDFTKGSRTRMHDRSARIGIIACLLTGGIFYLEFIKSLTIIEPFWNFCTFSGSPLNGQWVVRYPPIFGSKPSPWFLPLLLHLNPHLRPHPLQHQVRWEGLFKGLQRQPRGAEWVEWGRGMGEEGGLKRWTAGGTELEMGNWSECNFYSTWLFNHL